MFYFAIILAVVTLVYFLIGMISQQAVCKSFRDPSNSNFFKLVDQYDLSKTGLNIKVSKILISIHTNNSVYNVLDLKNQFDLDNLNQYLNQFKEQLHDLVKVVDKFDFSQFKILTKEQMIALENLPDPQVSKIETVMDNLNDITHGASFEQLNTALERKIDEIDKMKDGNEVLKSLRKNLNQAKVTLNAEMDILKTSIPKGTEIVKDLDKQLKFRAETFEDGRKELISIIEDVQELVGVRSPILFKKIVTDLSEEAYKVCEDYVNLVANDIKNDVGQCGPLGVIYDATLTSACDKVALQMDIYHKYNAYKDFAIGQEEDKDAKSEFLRQREFLERTVTQLKQRVLRNQSSVGVDKFRLVEENALLLVETNNLRYNLKMEQKQNNKLQSVLGFTKKYVLPKVAQQKLHNAIATRDEIRNEYQQRIDADEKTLAVLAGENQRLLKIISEEGPDDDESGDRSSQEYDMDESETVLQNFFKDYD